MITRFDNGIVVTLGDQNRILGNGSVVMEDDLIAEFGDTTEMTRQFPDAKSIDCSGKLIMPGFICTHHHFYSTMARGMGIPGVPAENFVQILERLWWKIDRALTLEDCRYSALVALVDAVRHGQPCLLHLRVVRLRSPRQADRWLQEMTRAR